MRYKCLVLDHDDTVVDTTPSIHYPAFLEAMRVIRPDEPLPTVEEFIGYNFHPGFEVMLRDVKRFTDEEVEVEQRIWHQFSDHATPEAYPGFRELLDAFRAEGGKIAVVSHSHVDNIVRHYRALFGFVPDVVYGWERPEHERKPHAFPLVDAMRLMNLGPRDLIMVDDLKPGLDMAQACGVDFAYAGWSCTSGMVGDQMRAHATYAFDTVGAFADFLFR